MSWDNITTENHHVFVKQAYRLLVYSQGKFSDNSLFFPKSQVKLRPPKVANEQVLKKKKKTIEKIFLKIKKLLKCTLNGGLFA